MVLIILAAGCEAQSDDMKKDIIVQDGLPEMDDSAVGKEEAILPDEEENAVNRTENTHEDCRMKGCRILRITVHLKKNMGG